MANVTKTIASSGGDYTSLNDGLAACASDITTNCVGTGGPGILTFNCQNFSDAVEVAFPAGYTSSATYPIVIQATNSHGGKWSTSAYRLNVQGTVDDGCFRINQAATVNYIKFIGIQFREYGTTNYTYGIRLQSATAGSVVELDKCILVGDHGDADEFVYGIYQGTANIKVLARNTLIYGWQKGWQAVWVSGTNRMYGCTIDDCGSGIFYSQTNNAGITLIGTRITGCTNAIYKGSTGNALSSTSDYNLSDADMSAVVNWGANSIDSGDTPTINYVDDSNATKTSRDYHLASGDSGIGAGTDLSSDPNMPFSDDIDGETRG